MLQSLKRTSPIHRFAACQPMTRQEDRNQMDAVDDIPAELKDKIARAADEEITRQAAHSLRMARWDYFKVFRAGLTPCRERLNQLRADTTKEG